MTRAAVIGSPVSHSLSPAIHRVAFGELGVDWTYEAIECLPEGLDALFAEVRRGDFGGLSVTMPLKEAVIPYLDVVDEDALALNAVNCISVSGGRLRGHNTDGDGCCDAIEEASGSSVADKDVVLLGAGGTARSVALAMVRRRARVHVVNRTESNAAALVEMVVGRHGANAQIAVGVTADIAAAGILVNTTSVGMNSRECPVDPGVLHAGLTVLDAVYSPLETELLRHAAAAGARTVDGLWMLIHQARHQQRLWFGRMASAGPMRAESERELAGRPK